MKNCFLIVLFSFFSATIFSQKIDSAIIDNKNVLAVEGGGRIMKIDTISTLDQLINKLNNNWKFNSTGKGYWIGYTEDMFSIANRGDEAISELKKFYKTTANSRGKLGVLYTLHLIGIDRHIVGRFYEKFTNKEARNTLLELLNDKQYAYTITTLLMRNPWPTDIPVLLDIIKNGNDEDILWPIINSLNRYKISSLPIQNEIPKEILSLNISLDSEDENILERKYDFNSQIKKALKLFGTNFSNTIKIESGIYNIENVSPYYKTELNNKLSLNDFFFKKCRNC